MELYFLRLTLSNRIISLADIGASLVSSDIGDGQGLLSADNLPAAITIPNQLRCWVTMSCTGDSDSVSLADITNIARHVHRDLR